MSLPTYLSGNVQTKAYAILREQVYTVLEKYELTPSLWAMLGVVLAARDGIRQSDIAHTLGVKPPLITMMSRTLQKQGLVESVVNQFDTRAKLLNVTSQGKKFMKTVEKELHEQLDILLNGLTENDMVAYLKVLETIIANKKRSLNKGENA